MGRKHLPWIGGAFVIAFGLVSVVYAPFSNVALAQGRKPVERKPIVLDRPPVRAMADPFATFNGIALDPDRGEVFISNDNRSGTQPSIQVYPTEFKPTEGIIEPRRILSGSKTSIAGVCGLAISSEFKELFMVNADGGNNMAVFPLDGKGNIEPSRNLKVPHTAAAIFLDPKHDEVYLTAEQFNRITVYRRTANGDDDPLRIIQGPHTEMADPHGIYVDSERDEIYVTNFGYWTRAETGEAYALFGDSKLAQQRGSHSHRGIPKELAPSTGRFDLPSISVYSRSASGDTTPVRVIQGEHTGLNWPLGISLDPASNRLVVANSGNDSVLVFDRNAQGDAFPLAVIRGPATQIKAPTGVSVDAKRNELWVTNWENHRASVFPTNANGDAAPLRVIRSAAKDAPLASFGFLGAMTFDPKRQQLLVAN